MIRQPWSLQDIALLRKLYPVVSTISLAKILGRAENKIYAKAREQGLRKSADYLASPDACHLRRGDQVGIRTRFRAGKTPWNKGMKGLQIGGFSTRFQSGNLSGNANTRYKPIGSERINKNGYLQIKITDDPAVPLQRRWAFVHNLIWQSAHGRLVPPGFRMCYANGDRTDLRPENLVLTTPQEVMRRNTVHNLPEPLPQIIQLRGALLRKINHRDQCHGK